MRCRLRHASRSGRRRTCPVPMPTCQHTMSVTVSGPLVSGPTSSPSSTSSHHRGSAPRGASARVPRVDVGDLARRSRSSSSTASYFLRLARLAALGADHVAVLAGQDDALVVAEHLRRPFVDGAVGELAALVERRDQRVAPEHAMVRPAAVPTTPATTTRRTHGRRAAGRPWSARGPRRKRGDFVLADQGVATDERGRGDRTRPTRIWRRIPDPHHSGLASP